MTYLAKSLAELWISTPGYPDLNLLGTTVDSGGHTFTIKALDDSATWDNPQPIDTAVQRWMTDGAVASTHGHNNREIYFKVIVSAGTSAELAYGETALTQRSEQQSILEWISPEGRGIAPMTVFQIWTWHLEHVFDSPREARLARMYGIRMTAAPWARSQNATTVTANTTSGSPTVTSIDTCTSTTGWTGSPNAPTVFNSTAVRETQNVASSGGGGLPFFVQLTRAATVSGLSGVPYLVLDLTTGGAINGLATIVVSINSTTNLVKAAQIGNSSYWALPGGTTSFNNLVISASGHAKPSGGNVYVTVADVSSSTAVGGSGSAMQLLRTIAVGGAVPTGGSIQLASPSATALGTCLVYTCPDPGNGYSPPMRQYRVSGNTVTVDGAAVSGNHEAFITAGASAGLITYTVPTGQLLEGTYAVVARVNCTAGTAITFTVTCNVTGYTATQTIVVLTSSLPSGWNWVVLGTVALPAQALPAESTLTSGFTIAATCSPSTNVTLDEWYLLDVTHGDYSLLNTGTQTKLWLDAPDADPVRSRPFLYIGTQADRSDAAAAPMSSVVAVGNHLLDPDGAFMLTVTDGVANSAATASFYRRWHTHAAS